ncbi:MAG: replicative DNA helicase [Deltaproteobacteria bacterium]|nr:replicative DNA helicase [Deltaproteobacteria bacterium]
MSEGYTLNAASGRVPPNDLAAERAVLGGILLDNDALNVVIEILRPEDFYSDANRLIFNTMVEIAKNGVPVDIVTLRAQLATAGKLQSVGGDDYLLLLTNTIPTVANIEAHSKIIFEKSVIRRLIVSCHEIAARGYGDYGLMEEFLDGAERSVFEVSKQRIRHPYEHVSAVVTRTFEQVTAAAERKEHVTGLPTGFKRLDSMTAGMHAGDLIIVAGRPSMGKTAFALNVSVNACSKDKHSPVVVFSLEMPKEQLASRMLCSEAQVDAARLRTGRLFKEDWPKLAEAAGTISDLPIWIDDTPGLTLMELRAKARRLRAEKGLALIVIDYLQLMRSGSRNESREQEISEISRSLKGLAKELELPVLALSQLNRGVETRGTKDKRPQLSDLRESGAIEQDADTILFIYRDEVYNSETQDMGIAEIIVGKQRQGPTGTVRCRFSREFTRFDNLEERVDSASEDYYD